MFAGFPGDVRRRGRKRRSLLAAPILSERLESRVVLSNLIATYPLATAKSMPMYPTVGPDGAIWFVEVNSIGRISYGGDITQFPLPDASASPSQITAGADGNLWFTESTGKIGKISSDGTITEFNLPAGSGVPNAIAAGPDGNLWFTETGTAEIGEITPSGTITQYPEGTGAGTSAAAITAGPNGNMWFTEHGPSPAIAEIASDGTITRFPISAPLSGPQDIVSGNDGNLYFTDPVQGTVGRISTSGMIKEFHVFPAVDHLVVGPDSALYGEMPGGEMVRMNLSGAVSNELPVLAVVGDDSGLAMGQDGNFWVTETTTNAILSVPPDFLGASGLVAVADHDPSATVTVPLDQANVATITTAENDPKIADYTASIDWGDGSSPSSAVLSPLSPASGTYPPPGLTVLGSHSYAKAGTYTLEVTATSRIGQTISSKETIQVAPEVLVATASPLAGIATLSTGTVTLASVTDSLPTANTNLSATIDWGDGSSLTTGTIVADTSASGGGFEVQGSHTFAKMGEFPLTVTVTGATGATTSVTGKAEIASSLGLTTAIALPQTAQTGVALDPLPVFQTVSWNPSAKAGDFSAEINWGDGSKTSTGTIITQAVAATSPGVAPAIPAFTLLTVEGGHTFATAGSYPISITITSADGGSQTAKTTAVVTDPPPPVTTSPPATTDPDPAPPTTSSPPTTTDPDPLPISDPPPTPSPTPISDPTPIVIPISAPVPSPVSSSPITPVVSSPATPVATSSKTASLTKKQAIALKKQEALAIKRAAVKASSHLRVSRVAVTHPTGPLRVKSHKTAK